MFERYRRTVEETTELDLIPVMNLFMVLIPFLLMGAAFYHVGVIPASLPAHTPSDADTPVSDVAVTLNMQVLPDRLSLTAASQGLDPDTLAKLGTVLPLRNGEHDRQGLQAYLAGLKKRYPKSDTLIAMPHPDLPYQALVGILDAARSLPLKIDSSASETKAAMLFPVVVFSKVLEVEPSAEEDAQSATTAAESGAGVAVTGDTGDTGDTGEAAP